MIYTRSGAGLERLAPRHNKDLQLQNHHLPALNNGFAPWSMLNQYRSIAFLAAHYPRLRVESSSLGFLIQDDNLIWYLAISNKLLLSRKGRSPPNSLTIAISTVTVPFNTRRWYCSSCSSLVKSRISYLPLH